MDELRRALADVHGDIADMRETVGRIAGEVSQFGQSMNRLVGIVEGNQRANEAAHRAQDDRTAALHGDVRVALSRIERVEGQTTDHDQRIRALEKDGGRTAGETAAHRRVSEWLKLVVGGALGAAVTWIGQAMSSGRH